MNRTIARTLEEEKEKEEKEDQNGGENRSEAAG